MVEGTGGGRHRLIEALIRALARAGQQADDRELAEMLWLSRCLSAPATEAPPAIPAPEPEEFAAATPTPISSSEIEKEEQRPRRRPD
ncbi:MAG TPA: hypothetical protein PK018_08830, partial [Candidatus Competibacter sp.]|nr:hypothetical protein [Candidatus Competibacter sp.]